jgi:hypothetical protein
MAPAAQLVAAPGWCGLVQRRPRCARRARARGGTRGADGDIIVAVHTPLASAQHGPPPPPEYNGAPVTLLGVTGGTGASAVAGLVTAGVAPRLLRVLTRDPESRRARALARDFDGLTLVRADADDDSLGAALRGVEAVYVHALAGDSGAAEPRELARAARLAAALRAHATSGTHVVFNSAAGATRTPKPPVQARQRIAAHGALTPAQLRARCCASRAPAHSRPPA